MTLENFGDIHFAIMDIKARSLLAVDEKRWADFAACFTNDATIDYSRAAPPGSGQQPPEIPSIEIYVEIARTHVADAMTMHIPSAPVIEVLDADHALATWKVEEIFVRPTGAEQQSHRGYFLYQDEYRRTQQGWRISALTFIPWFSTPLAGSAV
jgi:hypothetical protein